MRKITSILLVMVFMFSVVTENIFAIAGDDGISQITVDSEEQEGEATPDLAPGNNYAFSEEIPGILDKYGASYKLSVWISNDVWGTACEEDIRIGDWVYFHYEILDSKGNRISADENAEYTVMLSFIADGVTERIEEFESEPWAYAGTQYNEGECSPGSQKLKVAVSGDFSKSKSVSWELLDTLPEITANPESRNVKAGSSVSFSVEAKGTNLSYQWYYSRSLTGSGTSISGATSAVYTLEEVPESRNGYYYYCRVKNYGNSSVYSSRALLSVDKAEYTVTYDANGGNSVSKHTDTVVSGELADLTPVATRTNYTFVGWNTSSSATTALSKYEVNNNVTLYAVWKAMSTVATPVIKESDVDGGKEIKITCSTPDAQIYYTTNGSTPDTGSYRYSGAIKIDYEASVNIKAIAVRSGYINSSVSEYTVAVEKAQKPVVSVPGGTIDAPTSVTISCSTPGAEIYYTLDGSTPDSSDSKYTGAIEITGSATLCAIARAPGYISSDCMTAVYSYIEIPKTIPSVSTNPVSDITQTSAVLSATLNSKGGCSNVIVEMVYWNNSGNSNIYSVKASSSTLKAKVRTLSPGSSYSCYARAINEIGDATGNIVTFSTLGNGKPQSVSVSPEFVSLNPNDTCQLYATVLPADAENRNVTWSSSDKTIATVSSTGKVTAKKAGTVTITVTTEVDRLTSECTVKITEAVISGKFDFSEWNMATNTSYFAENGFDWDTAQEGGNNVMSTAYLASWDGAVLEDCDEYPEYTSYTESLYEEVDSNYHVQDVIWIPGRTDYYDNDKLKQAIMKYGALYVSYQHVNKYYRSAYSSYYYPADGSGSGGHAVAVVGWDDNYSAGKFTQTPPGNGAFICKNSWGSDWGDDGYFYVSYYDKNFASYESAAFISLESNANYNKIYQYDPLGSVGAFGYKDTTYAANVFPQHGKSVIDNEILRAVSFYTYHANTSYSVYIVKNYKSSSSLNSLGSAVASGMMDEAGYHTVKLNKDITISAGTRFAVVVKQTVPNDNYAYIYQEYPLDGYSGNARANSDESYISSNGSSWKDLTYYYDNANFCIKAFTDNGSASESAVLFSGVDNNHTEWISDKVYTLEEVIESGAIVNPDYVNYVNQKKNNISLMGMEGDFMPGVVPPVIEIGAGISSTYDGAVIPSKYDLRTEKELTSVRNQGSYGTCWAHATYASLESAMMKKSKTLDATSMGDASGEDYITIINQHGVVPTGLVLSHTELELAIGSQYRIQASVEPEDATEKDVLWQSSNEDVAIADENGCVTAFGEGTAIITCTTANGVHSAECVVSVSQGAMVSGIELEYLTYTASVGEVFMIDYTVNPANALNREVEWSSSAPHIAAINENGVITALSKGTAVITVTTKDGFKTASLTLDINDGMDLAIHDVSVDFSGTNTCLSGVAEAQIENRTNADITATVIFAVYNKSGKMIAVSAVEKTVASGFDTVISNILELSDGLSEGGIIKCFIWNGYSNIKPVSSSASKEI